MPLALVSSMRISSLSPFILSLTLLGAGSTFAAAQTTGADNTKANKQAGQTADQQSQDKADLALVQKIRAAVVKDKTLSTSAHNCKIITAHGAVTLRGPVKSDKEKAAVEKIATDIAGEGKVSNQLTVPKSGK